MDAGADVPRSDEPARGRRGRRERRRVAVLTVKLHERVAVDPRESCTWNVTECGEGSGYGVEGV